MSLDVCLPGMSFVRLLIHGYTLSRSFDSICSAYPQLFHARELNLHITFNTQQSPDS